MPLTLSEFIFETFLEVAEGVRRANHHATITSNFGVRLVSQAGSHGAAPPAQLTFDVAFTVASDSRERSAAEGSASAGGRLFVVEVGGALQHTEEREESLRREDVHRIQFTVPITFA